MGDTNEGKKEDVSSAELTANYRCAFPEVSGDKLSQLLSSDAGRSLAEAFITRYTYPLSRRKISVCAGYFLKEVTRLINTKKYDSIISFASGFSLLTYLIAEKNPNFSGQFFDTDLPYMLVERHNRIANISAAHLDPKILRKLSSMDFDVEQAYREGYSLKNIFVGCKKPIFILDGLSYFLSTGCVNWLLEQMSCYDASAVTLYYWPDDMLKRSTLFANVFNELNKGMIKEELKSFWDEKTRNNFLSYFPIRKDSSLENVEKEMVSDETECLLVNPNTFFPIRLATGEQNLSSKRPIDYKQCTHSVMVT